MNKDTKNSRSKGKTSSIDKPSQEKFSQNPAKNPYIRVGTNYFKTINKSDRFGIVRSELKVWRKAEIIQDNGKDYLKTIPKFDDFTIVPNNLHYQSIIENCYNLYFAFSHKPQEGNWKWTEILLRHIFGEQYELGLRYLQILYLNPERLMPILVLVSKERQTGKTTFINWLNMIFGNNIANISPMDLADKFNVYFVTSNIITVEEAIIDKTLTVEKLKALATSKHVSVNPKFVNPYRVPFFGKIILASNNEEKFAKIDEDEIRFFIRKVGKPKIENHYIESDLVVEIPAFLHFLTTLMPVDFSTDRTGFTPLELENDSLKAVKNESKSSLYKSIMSDMEDLFLNDLRDYQELNADASSIKEKFFSKDWKIDTQSIRQVLKDEFSLKPDKLCFFHPFHSAKGKTGRPYKFTRDMFATEKQ